jgi:hypothetical protein
MPCNAESRYNAQGSTLLSSNPKSVCCACETPVLRRNKDTDFWLTAHRAQMSGVNVLAASRCCRSWIWPGKRTCEIDGSLMSAVMGRLTRAIALIVISSAVLSAAGCAAITPRNALPQAAATQIDPEGFHDIRHWGDEASPDIASLRPRRRGPASALRGSSAKGLNLLAISGGAEDGAFGAGLLAGWGDAGNRPVFDLVTGVSSGALIAPFVFLGREHDGQLREIFTSYGRKDIYAYDVKNLIEGSALVDDAPLSRSSSRGTSTGTSCATSRGKVARGGFSSSERPIWTPSGQCYGTWAAYRKPIV